MTAWLPRALRALLLLLPLALPPLALAQDADPPEYRKTIDEAVSEFSAQRYEEARALFKRAHEMSPNARTLRGLGMTAFELRMYVQTIRELTAALAETRKPLDAGMRASAQALIEKAREFVGRVQPKLDPPEAKLLVDGKPPEPEADGALLLDAGTHVLSATADGHKPSSVRIAIEGGSDQVLRLPLEPLPLLAAGVPAIGPGGAPPAGPSAQTPPPAPPPARAPAPPANKDGGGPPYRTLAWVTLAGAGVFGAASAAFWIVGSGQYDDLKKMPCGQTQTCSEAQIDDSGVATSDLLTTVFLGTAIASGVASGIFFVLASGSDDEAPPSASQTRVELAPLGVRVRGTW